MSAVQLTTRPYGAMAPDVDHFEFSAENAERVKADLRAIPGRPIAAARPCPCCFLAQEQHGGWLPKAAMDHVADVVGVARIRVYEVATFYDMYNTHPVGPIQVRVCTTTPCWLCGSDESCGPRRTSWNATSARVRQMDASSCVSSSAWVLARMRLCLWVDEDFYEDLDYARTRDVLAALKRGETPKPGSQTGRQGSMPMGGKTTLFDAPPQQDAREEAGN